VVRRAEIVEHTGKDRLSPLPVERLGDGSDRLGLALSDRLGSRDRDRLGSRDRDRLGLRDRDRLGSRDRDRLGLSDRDRDRLGLRLSDLARDRLRLDRDLLALPAAEEAREEADPRLGLRSGRLRLRAGR
jgi:hypothetical protein